MTLSEFREILLWCFVIDYGVLIFWLLTVIYGGRVYDLVARLYKVPRARVDEVNLLVMVLYKAGVILFVLVPLIALWIVGR